MVLCTACGLAAVQDVDGVLSCTNCGFMLADSTIVNEIGFQDSANGASSVVGQFVPSSGPRTLSMGGGRGMPQGHSRNSREVTIVKGKNIIARIAQQLPSLQNHQGVLDSAAKLYQHAVENKFIQGRKSENVAAACLYVACRRTNMNQLLIDFSDVLHVNVFVLGNVVVRFTQRLSLRLPLTDPSLYMDRFANDLDLGQHAYQVASTGLRLLSHMRRDWLVTGRRPAGLCGACLLVATRIHNFTRSENEVARVVRVSETTLARRITEFAATPTVDMLTEELGDLPRLDPKAVAPGLAMDPPAFARAEAAADRRRRLRVLLNHRPDLHALLLPPTPAAAAIAAAAAEAAAKAAALPAPPTSAVTATGAGADAAAEIEAALASLTNSANSTNSDGGGSSAGAGASAGVGGASAGAGSKGAAGGPAAVGVSGSGVVSRALAAAGSELPDASVLSLADDDLDDVVRQIRGVLKLFPVLNQVADMVLLQAGNSALDPLNSAAGQGPTGLRPGRMTADQRAAVASSAAASAAAAANVPADLARPSARAQQQQQQQGQGDSDSDNDDDDSQSKSKSKVKTEVKIETRAIKAEGGKIKNENGSAAVSIDTKGSSRSRSAAAAGSDSESRSVSDDNDDDEEEEEDESDVASHRGRKGRKGSHSKSKSSRKGSGSDSSRALIVADSAADCASAGVVGVANGALGAALAPIPAVRLPRRGGDDWQAARVAHLRSALGADSVTDDDLAALIDQVRQL